MKKNNIYEFPDFPETNKPKKGKLSKRSKIRIGIVISFIIVIVLIVLYFVNLVFSKSANIKTLKIVDNEYFNERQIRELVKLDFNENYYFFSTDKIAKKFDKWDIVDVEVSKTSNNSITIKFINKKLVAYYVEDNEFYLLDGNQNIYKYQNDYFETLKLMPCLIDFDATERADIAKMLSSIDHNVVKEIAEIQHYSTSYDKNMLKLTMGDGNKVYIERSAIGMLNNYYEVIDRLKIKNACLMFSAYTKTGFTKDCKEFDNEYKKSE